MQGAQGLVHRRGHDLALQALEHVRRHLPPVAHQRAQALRVKAQAQHVFVPARVDPLPHLGGLAQHADEALGSAVAQQRVPLTVQHEGGVGLVVQQRELERAAHAGHVVVAQAALLEHRREAPGVQQQVAFAQGQVQCFGQCQQQLAAGPGAA
jgi:hypothetical protein